MSNGQVQIGRVGRGCAPGVDSDDEQLRATCLFRHDALINDGMTPGQIGAYQHDKLGAVQILVAAGHCVGTECALVTDNTGCHAQPGVGINVGCTQPALGQLVNHIIVFCQYLTTDIEGNRVMTILTNRVIELFSNVSSCLIPADLLIIDVRV